jgi:ketosteroid isomerase-like protein
MENFKKNPPKNFTLTWDPKKVEVSGSLAYTFGEYTMKSKTTDGKRDTTLYGNYVSIWKRKKDGSWRFVFDTGNPIPGPLELK